MIETYTHPDAPDICLDIVDRLAGTDKEFKLVLQLYYRDSHTVISLKNVREIRFNQNYIEIKHDCGSTSFYAYDFIVEYHIVNDIMEVPE